MRYLLTILFIVTFSAYAFAQNKTYNIRYTKIIKDSEVASEGGSPGQLMIVDEVGKKLSLLSPSTRTPDRIFRIVEHGQDKNNIVYRCKTPAGSGFATVFFFVDTFYKTINVVALQDCINFYEDREEIEYKDYLQYTYR